VQYQILLAGIILGFFLGWQLMQLAQVRFGVYSVFVLIALTAAAEFLRENFL
jgi:hypothetical protein